MTFPADTLVVGLGSAHGDDQIGWLVADSLASCVSPAGENLQLKIRQATIPLDVLDWLPGIQCLLLCDAMDGPQPSGTVWRRQFRPAAATPLPADYQLQQLRSRGSHDYGLAEVLELADRLGCLPPQVTIYGIAAGNFTPGTAVSPKLLQQLPAIIQELIADLHLIQARSPSQ